MPTSVYQESSGRGSARPKMGRPEVSDEVRRINVTVKVRPDADLAWAELAKKAVTSKGGLVEWLVLSAEASSVRALLADGKAVEQFRRTLPEDARVEVEDALAQTVRQRT